MLRLTLLVMVLSFVTLPTTLSAQFGVGMVFSNELFQAYQNPKVDESDGSVNSVLLSPNFGPKLYFGNESYSVSAHFGVGISLVSMDWSNYKGMGTLYAPAVLAFNFGGLSGFSEEGSSWGGSIGGGVQFGLTDLYFKSIEYAELERSLLATPFVQLAAGFGTKGTAIFAYAKYGSGTDDSSFFSIGIGLEVNFLQRKNYR